MTSPYKVIFLFQMNNYFENCVEILERLSHKLEMLVQVKCEVKVKSLSCVQLFVTRWSVAHQAPQSMEFSSKSPGVGCHFLLQGIFPTQGLNPGLPHCRQILYQLSYKGSSVSTAALQIISSVSSF